MVLFAALAGGLTGASNKIVENNDEYAESQARQQKALQEKFKELAELKTNSLYFSAPESITGTPFSIPVPTNPIEVPLALQKLSGYNKAGSLWNNRNVDPGGWQGYRDAFQTLLGETLRNQVADATNEGVDVAVSIPDFVTPNISSFNRLYDVGVPLDEINSMITTTASTVLREVTQEELSTSYLFYQGPDGQIKQEKIKTNLPPATNEKVAEIGQNATLGTNDAQTGVGYVTNSISSFVSQYSIFDNKQGQERITNFLHRLNKGFENGTVQRGLRTFIFTDPTLEKEMLEIYDDIGSDEGRFKNFVNLMTASIPDSVGLSNQKFYVGTDRQDRKQFQVFNGLSLAGEEKEKQLQVYLEDVRNRTDLANNTRIIVNTLLDKVTELGMVGLTPKVIRFGVGATEQVRELGNAFSQTIGFVAGSDDEELLVKYEKRMLAAQEAYDSATPGVKTAKEVAVLQSQIEYLNVQLLYTLARLLENPDGGPARLAAQDIEIMALALRTGANFTTLDEVKQTLNLVLEMTDNQAQHLNTINNVTDARVVHWANALNSANVRRKSLRLSGSREQRKKQVLDIIYDQRGISQDQRVYGQAEKGYRGPD